MPTYKITRVYIVDADSKAMALKRLKEAADELEYQVYISIRELTQQTSNWAGSIKRQVFGEKKRG